MKKLYFSLLALTLSFFTFGQYWDDTDEVFLIDSICFEEPSPWIQLNTDSNVLWQVAPPQKTKLNAALSPVHAIITDSTAAYPTNNHSYFDIILDQDVNTGYGYFPYNFFIHFNHKIDTDTLKDGGYMSVSIDNGDTFYNITDPNGPYISEGSATHYTMENKGSLVARKNGKVWNLDGTFF